MDDVVKKLSYYALEDEHEKDRLKDNPNIINVDVDDVKEGRSKREEERRTNQQVNQEGYKHDDPQEGCDSV